MQKKTRNAVQQILIAARKNNFVDSDFILYLNYFNTLKNQINMKKIISVLAITAFTFAYSQETPKKDCCAGKDKKECKMDGKKTTKTCDMKDHKDCKTDHSKDKKEAKKVA